MRYRLLIVAATLIWGSSFVIIKDTTSFVSPAWILAVRFLISAFLLFVFLLPRRRIFFRKDYVAYGALCGVALFLGYYLQTVGITATTPGKNAFLTGTYCVIVPFVGWAIIRKRPSLINVMAALLCLLGIALVSLTSAFSIGFGDALTLGCAVFYALHIVLVSRFSKKRDIYVLTMWQFACVGVCSLLIAFVGETPPVWSALPPATLASLAYLTVGCTALALLFQNVGQANLPPTSAALLLSLESVFGVIFSVLLGSEILSKRVILGFACIFLAILISEVDFEALKQRVSAKRSLVERIVRIGDRMDSPGEDR